MVVVVRELLELEGVVTVRELLEVEGVVTVRVLLELLELTLRLVEELVLLGRV